jgi:hypothetical protein
MHQKCYREFDGRTCLKMFENVLTTGKLRSPICKSQTQAAAVAECTPGKTTVPGVGNVKIHPVNASHGNKPGASKYPTHLLVSLCTVPHRKESSGSHSITRVRGRQTKCQSQTNAMTEYERKKETGTIRMCDQPSSSEIRAFRYSKVESRSMF